jgi:hypothetical protein
MNCRDCSEKLDAYVDRELPADEIRLVESHLTSCAACQRALESMRRLRIATAALPRDIAPARELWPSLASQLNAGPRATSPRRLGLIERFVPLAIAASVASIFFFANQRAPATNGWDVASLAGSPRVNARAIATVAQLRIGEWLETDDASRAKVAVGTIGEVNVEPNSRLRLVATAATDHRLELQHGELHAMIWAPPRLFFVNTPSATAVDLGCAYTLKVDDAGAGVLKVTTGYVALEHDGRESIIPAGFMCATRRGVGPGTPFAADAPDALRRALEKFDFAPAAAHAAALTEILSHARADDYVTLWHLLTRTVPAERGAVFDALSREHPAPATVTRAGIVAGDEAMRLAWAESLGVQTFAAKSRD